MREGEVRHVFYSTLGKWMQRFIKEHQACGYRYVTEGYRLRRFDQFLLDAGLQIEALPRELVVQWTAKRSHESLTTQRQRVAIVRRFAQFLLRQGIPAYVPESTLATARDRFTPRILNREEVRRFLCAADKMRRDGRAPWRHHIMPELFRLFYGCGLRLGEALRLTGADVDLNAGILCIRESKFGKDRLVPMAPSQTTRLQRYLERIGGRTTKAIFFPAPDGYRYSHQAVYTAYRQLLRAACISHEGRGRGPRIHDLRATFAVHRLEAWYRQGENLGAKLPVLSAYLGHASLYGTQHYLVLTTGLFPDIVGRLDEQFGHLIPRRVQT
jgi:integrase